MTQKPADNPNTTPPEGQKPQAHMPPPAARAVRRTTEQTLPTPSTDAFSTPSEPDAPQTQVFSGPEPAIFGGVNPPTTAQPTAASQLPPEISPHEPGPSEEDEVAPGKIRIAAPRRLIQAVLQSNSLLALMMLLSLMAATILIVQIIPAECYVHTSIPLSNYAGHSEEQAHTARSEIEAVLRGYPMRAAAKKQLAKVASDLPPGFLDRGILFQNNDQIQWGDDRVTLVVNTDKPEEDAKRLQAVANAFLQVMNDREAVLREREQRLANYKLHLESLQQDQNDLQARQTRSSTTAPSIEDARLAESLRAKIETAQADVAKAQQEVDVWVRPAGPDPAGVQRYDNRAARRIALRITWIAIAGLFSTAIARNYLRNRRDRMEQRQKNRALREAANALRAKRL